MLCITRRNWLQRCKVAVLGELLAGLSAVMCRVLLSPSIASIGL
jgi:hypothetical protein